MAKENQDGQEKTEDPTAQRLSKMRSEAQVPRSQELKVVALTLAGAALIFLLGQHFGSGFSEIFKDNFTLDRADLQGNNAIYIHLSEAAQATFWMLMPFFIGMIILAIIANTIMGGFVISKKKLKDPKAFRSAFQLVAGVHQAKAVTEPMYKGKKAYFTKHS